MAIPKARRLGKLVARHDPRTLQLANYVKPELPPPPREADWTKKIKTWPMMANDRIGDCTCAAAGHLIQEWTANASGDAKVVPTKAIIGAYAAISGYDPASGAHDNGANELDVLNYWRRRGIGGHVIDAYVALEPRNHAHVMESVYLFGGCYIGVALPLSAQRQRVWAVPPGGPTGAGAPNSWGGHAVPVVAYDARGLTVVTWGALVRMTWGFWEAYCDEAYAILSKDWLAKNKAPSGLDVAALQADLKAIGTGAAG